MMRLLDLLASLPVRQLHGSPDTEVRGITDRSAEVDAGWVFVAVRGLTRDGHAFVPDAIARGASALVVERSVEAPAHVARVEVPSTRDAIGPLAAAFHGHPSRRMRLFGVTGTNGKTTTTYLLESLVREAGGSPGVVGTVCHRFAGRTIPADNTTPDAVSLQSLFADMLSAGVTHVLMEVSSHALDMRRCDGSDFAIALFTNLSQDHLDYHGDMNRYAAAKRRLFAELLPASRAEGKAAILNADDPRARDVGESPGARVLRFSARVGGPPGGADVFPRSARVSVDGIEATLVTPSGPVEIRSALFGEHNLQNLCGAAAAGVALGFPVDGIGRGLSSLPGVPGRLERVGNARGVTVLVDYAHTPDALERVLSAVRGICKTRLIALFGCGGDRDRTKRAPMGEAAARIADLCIVTSDNPRTETPMAIIEEILPGVRRTGKAEVAAAEARAGRAGFVVEPDRRAAIRLAAAAARRGDTLVIAGKGHEDYQILGKTKVHFDDREEARAALEAEPG